ncbi:YqaJ viral recombinase family protein [Cryobacterium psychrophilum]|uniref:YqaJ viral recombinase domain-containing protein n=1 Tax=Cryobacterium psychrophilum TaxID=41988 RepID=A0A4Y8KPZ0_9MICO|nr:YqaJ viral recombinase family protein [Cryobacterium psychrophilum]TDW30988.1 YqaJ-like recombinase protein [Cryobacterium psychrophilum]TFD80850.1 hypothetical protein E3T53_04295 [Cryobacterium psychrophilum]
MNLDNALDDLLSRAGSSSEDRPAWHAERNGGVTATDIAKLDNGGPAVRRRLIEGKRAAGEPAELKSRAVAYGKQREAPLAEWVQRRYGIKPNTRVFHAALNSRHLATPDGIGINFDEALQLAEIKTTSTPLDTIPRSYLLQMLWQLIVCGADRTLFVWELHDNDWSHWPKRPPQPVGDPVAIWLTRSDIEALLKRTVDQLVITADEFLTLLDTASEEAEVLPEADELERLAGSLLFHRDAEALAKASKVTDWDALNALAAIRGEFATKFAHASLSYKVTKTDSWAVDLDAAKADDPDLAAAHDLAQSKVLANSIVTRDEIAKLSERARAYEVEQLEPTREAWALHLDTFTTNTPTSSGKLTVTAVKTKDTK